MRHDDTLGHQKIHSEDFYSSRYLVHYDEITYQNKSIEVYNWKLRGLKDS